MKPYIFGLTLTACASNLSLSYKIKTNQCTGDGDMNSRTFGMTVKQLGTAYRDAQMAMQVQAITLGVKNGVMGVLILREGDRNFAPFLRTIGTPFRMPQAERGPDDLGTNYYAYALMKMAGMIVTGANSDEITQVRPLLKGEVNVGGGLVVTKNGHLILAFFSGGTPEQDAQIAKRGLTVLEKAFASAEAVWTP